MTKMLGNVFIEFQTAREITVSTHSWWSWAVVLRMSVSKAHNIVFFLSCMFPVLTKLLTDSVMMMILMLRKFTREDRG
jgi:hypothetical protein